MLIHLFSRIKPLLWLLGALFLSAVTFHANATLSNISSTEFDCKTLYAATPNHVYSVTPSNAGSLHLYQTSTSTATIALGKWGGA